MQVTGGKTDKRQLCHRYLVKDMLGQGTFGQVVKCYCEETGEVVAVKVIKNQEAFFQQVSIMQSQFLRV